MGHITLRDIPDDLHTWLTQQAAAHRRPLDQEVIIQLDSLRPRPPEAVDAARRLVHVRQIMRRTAALPALDQRPEAEILGWNSEGLPE